MKPSGRGDTLHEFCRGDHANEVHWSTKDETPDEAQTDVHGAIHGVHARQFMREEARWGRWL